jgi:Family of unknown function (DUF5996)
VSAGGSGTGDAPWPDLPFAAWSDTCNTLQLWTQVVGKVRIALTPLINHWWNATFFVTARGLAAPAMPFAGGMVDVTFDFASHRLVIETSDGRAESFALKPMAVCDFYTEFMARLRRLGVDVQIKTMPCEIAGAIPFDGDRVHAHYDPEYARRFWHALVQINRVMNVFRARFLGKASPVHFFWGSFDLVVTRFSGRSAPPPKGHTPCVADWIMAEAYSHECSSCGFWPGNGGFGSAAFFVYAYPEPAGYGDTRLSTAGASYNKDVGQFILPYDAVRQARDPDALLLGFLQETYAAAADLAKWDRKALERASETR